MRITINKSQFRDEFARQGRGNQFSYEALGLLFDYFEDCGLDYELDVIGICCEFVEMSKEEICEGYNISTDKDIELLFQDSTIYIGATDAGHVFAQF